jgi:hypothetical protein
MAFLFYLLIITNLVVAHVISDIFCQPRAWALAKHNDWSALGKHVSLYVVIAWLLSLPSAFFLGPWSLAALWIFNGATHFVVDAITSRGNHKAWQYSLTPGLDQQTVQRERFYAIAWICVDQVLHVYILFLSALLLPLILIAIAV